MTEKKYEMLNDRVLFRKYVPPETKGGIYIPPNTRSDRSSNEAWMGEVLAVGPGREVKNTGERLPVFVNPGDLILYNERSAMKLDHTDRGYTLNLRIINERDILGTTDKPTY